MIREIKFRAWDKDSKRYGEVVEIEYNESREIDGIWVWYNIHERHEPIPGANVTVEQYTGLKDKNGKEIYEGDIVKCILGNKPIVFHDCRYWLGETLDDLFVANLRYDIEIIGNIHENQELLGGEE